MNQANADKLAKELENWPAIKQDVENLIEESQDWEEPYNIFDAFDLEFDLAQADNHPPRLTNFRRILIAVGYYREVSEEELSSKVGNYKGWDFKLNHKKWDSDMSLGRS